MPKPLSFIQNFLRMESAGGLLLMAAAGLALLTANSPLFAYYNLLLDLLVEIRIGSLEVSKPLLLWVNDGLMALFFLLVGLELKRELLEGELSSPDKLVLPGIAAIGGMLFPALIYIAFNRGDEVALQGWAIPAATDIAFALGVLSLLGSRVPVSIKIFLTALAIFDDIGAILIIAFFYTSKLSLVALLIVAICLPVLWFMNKRQVLSISAYLFVGLIMWVAMLKSGVHATLTGVILAFFIPLKTSGQTDQSPLKSLEHDLHTLVAFLVLPLFAFFNAGINLSGLSADQLLHGVPLGIALGLFLGKQLGIWGLCWLAVQCRLTSLPSDFNWRILYGVSALAGIGFTMSLFIGSLAFEETGVDLLFDERLGILIGSLLSGVVGYLVLRYSLPDHSAVD